MAKSRPKGNELDNAIHAGNIGGRQVAGTGYAYGKVDNISSKDFAYELVKRKGNAKSDMDPSVGTKKNRAPVMQDRLGPRFAIAVNLPGPQHAVNAPEAGMTQQNTRFMPSVINRSMPNFNYGRLG